MPDTPAKGTDAQFRNTLAQAVLVTSVAGVFLLSGLVIGLSSLGSETLDSAKFVFGSILPLIGAWVGTLLAFYFSRENFEAATRSVTEMAKGMSGFEKLKSIPVKDKMRPLSDIKFWPFQPGEEDKCKLSDLLSHLSQLERIPILDDQKRLVYLIYQSMIHRFLSQVALDPNKAQGKALADLTLKNLLDSDPKLKDVFQKCFGFVPETATLADAKLVMDTISQNYNCDDVFVTKTGKTDESVLGWITNNTLAENAKV